MTPDDWKKSEDYVVGMIQAANHAKQKPVEPHPATPNTRERASEFLAQNELQHSDYVIDLMVGWAAAVAEFGMTAKCKLAPHTVEKPEGAEEA